MRHLYRHALATSIALVSTAVPADFQHGLDAFQEQAYGTAQERWRECALADVADCQYGIGVLYDDGLGVEADTFEALRWYEQAARKSHPDALMQLGFIYATGRGDIIQDPILAWAYFARAATLGVAGSVESRERVGRDLTVTERARAEQLADELSIRYHLQK